MTICNSEIRSAATEKGVRLWQIAEAMGLSESAFCRKMRRELPPELKSKALEIIEKLSKEA